MKRLAYCFVALATHLVAFGCDAVSISPSGGSDPPADDTRGLDGTSAGYAPPPADDATVGDAEAAEGGGEVDAAEGGGGGDGGPDDAATDDASDGAPDAGPVVPVGPLLPATACRKVFGSQINDRATKVAMDHYGNFAVLFEASNPDRSAKPTDVGLDFGGGPLIGGGYLAVFDSACTHAWSRVSAAKQVAFSPSGDLWTIEGARRLVKSGLLGNVLVDIELPAAVNDLAVDGAGNVVVQGALTGPLDFGACQVSSNGPGFYVAKLDPTGSCIWGTAIPWNGATSAAVVGARISPNDDVIVGGRHQGIFDLGGAGTPLFAAPPGQSNGFLIRMRAADGHLLWGTAWNVGSTQTPIDSFDVDDVGDIYLAGGSAPSTQTGAKYRAAYVARHDGSGARLWNDAVTFAMSNFERPLIGALVSRGGGAYVTVYESFVPTTLAHVVELSATGISTSGGRLRTVTTFSFRGVASTMNSRVEAGNVHSLAAAPDGRFVAVGSFFTRLLAPWTATSKKMPSQFDDNWTEDALLTQVVR